MFGFIRKSIFGFFSNSDEKDLVEEEQEILDKLNGNEAGNDDDEEQTKSSYQNQRAQTRLGERRPVEYECEVFQCTRKKGVVTKLEETFGIIDDSLCFQLSQVPATVTLSVNDTVWYTTYKPKGKDVEKVFEIICLEQDLWGNENSPLLEKAKIGDEEGDEIAALTRVLNGRITKKKERQLFIEPCKVWCDLDKLEVSYIPLEGDWVSLEVSVTLNKENVDFCGEVLEVKSLKPILNKSGFGKVTLWSKSKGEGAIDNGIYFCSFICDIGYTPSLGDTVVYDAIESDQDTYKWRALKVLPHLQLESTESESKQNAEEEEEEELTMHEVDIKPNPVTVTVELGKTSKFSIHVKNNRNVKLNLIQVKFTSPRSRSQLHLISPKFHQAFCLDPKETITYAFEARGRFLGVSHEKFCFYFARFKIFRKIEITVQSTPEMDRFLKCDVTEVPRPKPSNKYVYDSVNMSKAFFGRKPWKPPKFALGDKKHIYKVPNKLWEAVVTDDKHKSLREKVRDLENYAPYFKEDITFKHYTDWFHTLLYLEEIEIKKNFRSYDISGGILLREGEYFTLKVPGLCERRPSIIVGDKIIVTRPWSEDKHQQVGFVHEVRRDTILIKFHTSFHDTYDESECDIIFDPNLSYLWRSHDAVNKGASHLGANWLFPNKVCEKPPLVDLVMDEITKKSNTSKLLDLFSNVEKEDVPDDLEMFECSIDEEGIIGSEELLKTSSKPLMQKEITWFNKHLNERQKIAVLGALRAQGRPLPYIIFGPPGTGKTMTVVEIILQIYKMIPDSRILVVSPSNSSADLICDRLIEEGKLLPGELVRLIAFYRANEGNLDPKIAPYCSLLDNKEDMNRSFPPRSRKTIGSTNQQIPGRSRITCGTCTCVGSLHFVGYQPGHFSHVIIDEAGQATEPEALIASTFVEPRTGVVILAGDPQQLGPVCVGKLARKYGLTVSLLQRFVSSFPYIRDMDSFPSTSGFDKRFITRLNINYRSLPEILSLPSQLFYNSELIPTVSDTDSPEADIVRKLNIMIEGKKTPASIIFHGVIGQNYQEQDSPSWFNPHEIWVLATYLRKVYSAGYTVDDVGIITPYLKQAQKIRNLLETLNVSLPKVGTVEDFQGQERNIILLSAVRSSFTHAKADVRRNIGFLASPRRLNVALTRARAILIIIGNPAVLCADPYWKNVIRYCAQINSYTGCNINSKILQHREEDYDLFDPNKENKNENTKENSEED